MSLSQALIDEQRFVCRLSSVFGLDGRHARQRRVRVVHVANKAVNSVAVGCYRTSEQVTDIRSANIKQTTV